MLHGSQHAAGIIALVISGSMWGTAFCAAATVRSSANFTVLAPSPRLADMVVDRAEALRIRISAAWLGKVLPATRTPTAIFIEVDPARSFARTLIDPDGHRHMVWLVGSEEAVTRYLLAHEVAHVVLAGQFADSMPEWANEGIASRYDNNLRKEIRQRELREFVTLDSWPHLDRLFEGPIRQQWQYAAATSVTDFLVRRGGQEAFVEFVADARSSGWDTALATHYDIRSLDHLQDEWQRAVRQSHSPAVVATSTEDPVARYVR